jgi:hypothetical protein
MKLVEVVRKFCGAPGDDVEQWLDRYSVATDLLEEFPSTAGDPSGTLAKEKKMAKIIPLLLEGAAYCMWKQLPTADKENWSAIGKALRRTFGKSKASAWQELKALRFFPGDSVDVMADQVKTLLRIVAGGSDPQEQLTAAFLLDTLPPRVAEQVRLQHGDEMELEKVMSCAKSLLISSNNAVSSAAAGGFRRNQQEYPSQLPLRCFGCGESGHLLRNCPKERSCYRCRRKGHLQRYCPEARQAGNEQAEAAAPGQATPAVQH